MQSPSSHVLHISNILNLCQITGKTGMVIKGHVNRSAFEDIFKARNILDQNPDVEKFLENMVGDEEG
jgi:hypothetical protein